MIIDMSTRADLVFGITDDEPAGLPITRFDTGWVPQVDPGYAYLVESAGNEGAAGLHHQLTALIDTPGVDALQALVLPERHFPYRGHGPVAALVAAADRLTSLVGLHIGRPIRAEPGDEPVESEDLTSLLRAYLRLELLRIQDRVPSGFTAMRHESLRELVIEVASDAGEVARQLSGCDLPELEHLEFRVNAKGPVGLTVEDLAPILAGTRLPKLVRLGLHCGVVADDVAAALATAPVVARLHTLALSGGGLTDRGAEALLAGRPLTHLKRLDVRDQRLSGPVAGRVVAAVPDGAVDVSTHEQREAAALEAHERDVAAGKVEIRTFAGLPIDALVLAHDIDEEGDAEPRPCLGRHLPWRPLYDVEVVTRFDTHAWHLSAVDSGGDVATLLADLADSPGADGVHALVIGDWGSPIGSGPPIAELVAAADRLPNLRALFIGDMEPGQCEISWIHQDDVAPLLHAYPRLEVLQIRGSNQLRVTPLRHDALRELVIESGGLPGEAVRDVAGCDLPMLEHLELWLGTDDYGGDSTVDDLAPILAGERFPRLTTLALRDAEIADQIAEALASAPVVARLSTLDLSLGVLSDRGAEALLAGQPLTHLKRLDLHHHYLSEAVSAQLVAALPGAEVDVSDHQDTHEYGRYVAVSE